MKFPKNATKTVPASPCDNFWEFQEEDDDDYCERVGENDRDKVVTHDAITYRMGQEHDGTVCYLPGPDKNVDKGRWRRTSEEQCEYVTN